MNAILNGKVLRSENYPVKKKYIDNIFNGKYNPH